jgi:hypothetical protein
VAASASHVDQDRPRRHVREDPLDDGTFDGSLRITAFKGKWIVTRIGVRVTIHFLPI